MQFRPRGSPRFGKRRDQWRVVMLVGALVIVLLAIFKSADPRHWAWLKEIEKKPRAMSPREEQHVKQIQERLTAQAIRADKQKQATNPPALPQAAKNPQLDQQSPPAVADLTIPKAVFAKINEETLFIREVESSAYWTVLAKVRDVPQADLERAALKDVTYTQVFSAPEAYRGRLITLVGELVQLRRLPESDNDERIETVYEGWLINADSGKNPYVFHCLDKPAGLVEGDKLSEKVRITGYFFKRYQYPAKSGLTYAAPMLLAKRIRWFPPVQRKAAADPHWIPYLLGGIVIVGVSLGVTVCWLIVNEQRRSNNQLRRFIAPPITEFDPIEPPPEV